LESLGVDPKKIFFQVGELNIPDGQTFAYISPLRAWLKTWSFKNQSLTTIYVPAWEGGHPDHDVLHAVAVFVGKSLLHVKVLQYPLYNSYGLFGGFFRVLYPLDTNGEVLRQFIPWPVRFKHLMLCFSYKSQFVSWLGLYPFVFCHYLFNGCQHLQPTSLSRVQQRPHSGQLYYEFRGFSQWQEIQSYLQKEL
jgi:hypothetical protein